MSGSAFAEAGFAESIDELVARTQQLYAEDDVPWVVGYSGGKDSTATLQLVWTGAARACAPEQRHKPVHVISTDTLVENPVVAAWVSRSLDVMSERGAGAGAADRRHTGSRRRSTDTFWVNLIGKGYPAPRPKFRWCTERLKIKPVERVHPPGGRRARRGDPRARHPQGRELSARRASMEAPGSDAASATGSRPNASLPNSLVYSPIEDWSNDDVWTLPDAAAQPVGLRQQGPADACTRAPRRTASARWSSTPRRRAAATAASAAGSARSSTRTSRWRR